MTPWGRLLSIPVKLVVGNMSFQNLKGFNFEIRLLSLQNLIAASLSSCHYKLWNCIYYDLWLYGNKIVRFWKLILCLFLVQFSSSSFVVVLFVLFGTILSYLVLHGSHNIGLQPPVHKLRIRTGRADVTPFSSRAILQETRIKRLHWNSSSCMTCTVW